MILNLAPNCQNADLILLRINKYFNILNQNVMKNELPFVLYHGWNLQKYSPILLYVVKSTETNFYFASKMDRSEHL